MKRADVAICHVARDIQNSGGGEVVRQLSRRMAEAGQLVTVVTDTPRCALDLPGVRVINTPFGGALLAWHPRRRAGWIVRHFAQILAFTFFGSLAALPLRLRGSIVFNHNCESLVGQVVVLHNVFSAELSRRQLGRLDTIRALLSPVRSIRIAKELLLCRPPSGRRLVAVSAASAPDVVRLAGGERRVVTIENGIDLEFFSPSEPISQPQFELDEWRATSGISRLVLFVGHEFTNKGLPELLDSLEFLPDDVGIAVVGGAAQDPTNYESRLMHAGTNERVYFFGEVPDVRPYLAACDLLCLPSHYETMGLAGLEALASGRPIVVPKDLPLAAFVRPGLTGALCQHDPQTISRAIAEVLEVGLPSEVQHACVEVVTHLKWDSRVSEYQGLVASLTSVRKR